MGNVTILLIITRWLQESGLIGQEKVIDFLKTTTYNQSRAHGFSLWSEFLAPWEADETSRKQKRSTIKKTISNFDPVTVRCRYSGILYLWSTVFGSGFRLIFVYILLLECVSLQETFTMLGKQFRFILLNKKLSCSITTPKSEFKNETYLKAEKKYVKIREC
jgi:hypothetical protein